MRFSPILNRVCFVGGGPGGFALAGTFKLLGIDFVIFERHWDVGGICDETNPVSPMYASAHFISSKTPDYPSNKQIHSYMKAFAREYGLYEDITFNTEVSATQFEKGGRQVRLSNGETRPYRWLICFNGQ